MQRSDQLSYGSKLYNSTKIGF